jgi:hypothetical protein
MPCVRQATKFAPIVEDSLSGINDMQFFVCIDYFEWKVNLALQNSMFFIYNCRIGRLIQNNYLVRHIFLYLNSLKNYMLPICFMDMVVVSMGENQDIWEASNRSTKLIRISI